jgi:hypothetical protein
MQPGEQLMWYVVHQSDEHQVNHLVGEHFLCHQCEDVAPDG